MRLPSREAQAEWRRAAEMEKRREFHGLILDIPDEIVTFEIAELVANYMAKIAAERLFPDEDAQHE